MKFSEIGFNLRKNQHGISPWLSFQLPEKSPVIPPGNSGNSSHPAYSSFTFHYRNWWKILKDHSVLLVYSCLVSQVCPLFWFLRFKTSNTNGTTINVSKDFFFKDQSHLRSYCVILPDIVQRICLTRTFHWPIYFRTFLLKSDLACSSLISTSLVPQIRTNPHNSRHRTPVTCATGWQLHSISNVSLEMILCHKIPGVSLFLLLSTLNGAILKKMWDSDISTSTNGPHQRFSSPTLHLLHQTADKGIQMWARLWNDMFQGHPSLRYQWSPWLHHPSFNPVDWNHPRPSQL